jgi:cytochrome b6-f complex iron-sulfur subunit
VSDDFKTEEVSLPKGTNRRGFLQWTLGGLLFGGFVVAGNVVLRYLMPPPPRLEKAGKVSIPVSQIPKGSSLMLKHQGSPVLAVHTEEGISAFSAVCTHLGCLVKWMPAEKIFYCPCHAGKFDSSTPRARCWPGHRRNLCRPSNLKLLTTILFFSESIHVQLVERPHKPIH